ncbi:hypothetical protein B0T39_12880 [Chromobacterium haemolyticum]|nr:hypothetical protein B0T39_12880 [Chromobacterium haemolyticum]
MNQHAFRNLLDARLKIDAWRLDYNAARPHSAQGYMHLSARSDCQIKSELLHLMPTPSPFPRMDLSIIGPMLPATPAAGGQRRGSTTKN